MIDENTIIQSASQLLAVTFVFVYFYTYFVSSKPDNKTEGLPLGLVFITAPLGLLFMLSIFASFVYSFAQIEWILLLADLFFISGVFFMFVLTVQIMHAMWEPLHKCAARIHFKVAKKERDSG